MAMKWRRAAAALVGICGAAAALAGKPVVEAVEAVSLGGDRWRVSVTVSHADSGWEHYADGWRVLDEGGRELGFRVLAHPHVDEQPFTRSLSLTIPASVQAIRVQAVDSVHGDGEASAPLTLSR